MDLSTLELNKPTKDSATGYWWVTGVAARVGVQDYTKEHGKYIYRGEDFVKAMTDALKGKPLTLGHFSQAPTKNRDKKAGIIFDTEYKDGLSIVRVCIDHPYLCGLLDSWEETKQDIHLGLSVGYNARVVDKEDVWLDDSGIAGAPNKSHHYQAEQTFPLVVNHLAVVPMGRGGQIVKLVMEDEVPVEEEEGTTFVDSVSLFDNAHEDGGALYPYPEKHSSSRRKQTPMTQDANDAKAMYEDMKAMMDKMSKYCDLMDAMQDKMTAACDSMSTYADNLSAAIDYIGAIKKAFESQDRNTGSKEVAVPTQNMIADSASKEFGDAVRGSVQMWMEFHDELTSLISDFSATEADMKRALLKSASFDIEDASDAEVNAAFSVYKTMRNKAAKEAATKASEVETVFKDFKSSTTEGNPSLGEGVTRSAGGTLSFNV